MPLAAITYWFETLDSPSTGAMSIEENQAFDCYRAALSRYRAAWADLRAEIAAGTPPTSTSLNSLKDAEIALSAAWRAYVDADPLVLRTDYRRRPKDARH